MKTNVKLAAGMFAGCIILMLTGCSNVNELEATIELQNERIAELEDRNTQLQDQLEGEEQLVSNYQFELFTQQGIVEQLNEKIEAQQPAFPEFSQGLIDDLIENVEELTIPFLGSINDPMLVNVDNISIHFAHIWPNSGQVIADVHGRATVRFIFAYNLEFEQHVSIRPYEWTADDWENVISVNWEVLGHIFHESMRLAEERMPRHLTDLETVTIRIYEYDWAHPSYSSWNYEEHVIQGEELWEETLRLMPNISDLWYEGSTLYVDLFPVLGRGSSYDAVAARQLQYTFSSFPHVSEIRFSIFGSPGLPDQRGGSHIFNVAERRAHYCEFSVDDPWVNREWWQNECE